jgi:hypothetical protein
LHCIYLRKRQRQVAWYATSPANDRSIRLVCDSARLAYLNELS